MEKQFTFDKYSNTIRLMPANYLVAVPRYENHGHFIADPDAAIEDELAARVFIMLRGLRFEKNKENVIASLNTLLLPNNEAIYKAMGQYLSDEEENYDAIIDSLREALTHEPDGMIDFVEYTEHDGLNVTSINVWEKVQLKFTVKEFCDLVGIS